MDKPPIEEFYLLSQNLLPNKKRLYPKTKGKNRGGFYLTDYPSIRSMASHIYSVLNEEWSEKENFFNESPAAQWIINNKSYQAFYARELSHKKTKEPVGYISFEGLASTLKKHIKQDKNSEIQRKSQGFFKLPRAYCGTYQFGFCASISYAIARSEQNSTDFSQAKKALIMIENAIEEIEKSRRVIHKQLEIIAQLSPLFFAEDEGQQKSHDQNMYGNPDLYNYLKMVTRILGETKKQNSTPLYKARDFFFAFVLFYHQYSLSRYKFTPSAICDLVLINNENDFISDDTARRWQEQVFNNRNLFDKAVYMNAARLDCSGL